MSHFGGSYAELTSRQKSLIDDLYRRFSVATETEINPEKAYAGERRSWRATFEALTHALSKAVLTDANGDSLG